MAKIEGASCTAQLTRIPSLLIKEGWIGAEYSQVGNSTPKDDAQVAMIAYLKDK
jgi:hypothetical protein